MIDCAYFSIVVRISQIVVPREDMNSSVNNQMYELCVCCDI
jgi:hypothetical protein